MKLSQLIRQQKTLLESMSRPWIDYPMRVSRQEVEEGFGSPDAKGLSVEQFYDVFFDNFGDRYSDEDYEKQVADANVGAAWYWYENGRWPPDDWSPFHSLH